MPVHVFDLDHTLLTANSSYRFGAYLYQQRFFPFSVLMRCLKEYACHRYLGTSMQRLHDRIFACLFKGRSLAEISNHLDLFLTQFLPRLIYRPAMEHLEKALQRQEKVFILSSSPDFLVQAIAKAWGVSNWGGTTYQVDSGGYLSAVTHIMVGEKKMERIQQWMQQENLSPPDVVAYSDSYLDLPLLKIVGKPVGVRPDRRLKRVCLTMGWEMIR